ncbi:MAG: CotH kinase family protein [Thermodesulfobacteriota bacterium]|nr:CotH kinase family protein [Thermodesulfobacteriota bacterium]
MKNLITGLIFFFTVIYSSIIRADEGDGDLTAYGNLPSHYYFSEDGSQLQRGKETRRGFYNIETVGNIYLTFESDNWFRQVYFATDTRVPATLTYQDRILENVGVQFKGMTSKMMTGYRKSFDIRLDYKVEGQDIDGYDMLNLHNTFDDPSYMREVFYLYQSRGHTTSADGNFINLYINGEFWGLYANVQQLDRDFLEEWYLNDKGTNWRAAGGMDFGGGFPGGGGMFNDGTTALNYLGDDPALYFDAYELKSTFSDNPYAYLASATKALDSVTPDTVADLNRIFNVDDTLWFLAYEILFGDDDGYVSKGAMDYMVYFDIETNRLVPYQYDGNTVMKWWNAYDIFYRSGDSDFPLMYKLFNIPELRQRYLAHVRIILLEKFNATKTDEILNFFHTLIDEGVANDPHPHWGSSYAGLPGAIDELRSFIRNRYALLSSHPEVSLKGPSISDVYYIADNVAMTPPDAGQPVAIRTTVNHESGVRLVYAYYGTGFMGTFDKLEMFDDGEHNDHDANDGIYGIELPPQAGSTWVRYYVEAVADDGAGGFGTVSYSPAGAEHDVYVYRVNLDVIDNAPLRINELMACNDATVADNTGEFDDWVELCNTTGETIPLDGYYLTDNAGNLNKWALPAVSIQPFGFVTFWLDADEEQGDDHAPFKLSDSGEELVLVNSSGQLMDAVSFGPQKTDVSFGRYPDGTGDFVAMSPTYGGPNNEGVVLGNGDLLINEFMADNETTIEDPEEPGEFPDWIEVYNQSEVAIDIGGMYMSDDLTNSTAWQIPMGTVIEAGGYLLIWADDDPEQGSLHATFKLGASGQEVVLLASDGMTIVDYIAFDQQEPDVSYGRLPDGGETWRVFGNPTPSFSNATPYVSLLSPEDGVLLSSPPTFEWDSIGYDAYLFHSVFYYSGTGYYTTSFWVLDSSLVMPSAWWDAIRSGSVNYWAVTCFNTTTYEWEMAEPWIFTKSP